jgi:hypothetical protein
MKELEKASRIQGMEVNRDKAKGVLALLQESQEKEAKTFKMNEATVVGTNYISFQINELNYRREGIGNRTYGHKISDHHRFGIQRRCCPKQDTKNN